MMMMIIAIIMMIIVDPRNVYLKKSFPDLTYVRRAKQMSEADELYVLLPPVLYIYSEDLAIYPTHFYIYIFIYIYIYMSEADEL